MERAARGRAVRHERGCPRRPPRSTELVGAHAVHGATRVEWCHVHARDAETRFVKIVFTSPPFVENDSATRRHFLHGLHL